MSIRLQTSGLRTGPRARAAAGLGLLVLLAPAAPRAADDLAAAPRAEASAMRFNFSARVATESYFAQNLRSAILPDWSRCYVRVREAGRARPLFIAGRGRRGRLDFAFVPEPVLGRGGQTVTCTGGAIVELDDYQATPGAADDGQAGAAWLRSRGKWRVTVRRVYDAVARDAGNELTAFIERRDRAAVRDEPIPEAFLNVKVDLELRAPTGAVTLTGQPAEIGFQVLDAERFGRRFPYWSLALRADLDVAAGDLGLPGAGAGNLEISVVLGTAEWVPSGMRQEEVPDVSDAETGGDLVE